MAATQFFLTQKMKFILLLPVEVAVVTKQYSKNEQPQQQHQLLEYWRDMADTFHGVAAFSYVKIPFSSGKSEVPKTSVAMQEVFDFFDIDIQAIREPVLVAHQTTTNHEFRAGSFSEEDPAVKEQLLQFVVGVMSGSEHRVLKSEPIPNPSSTNTTTTTTAPTFSSSASSSASRKDREAAVTAVGRNVVDIAGAHDKDVLLLLYKPWCSVCVELLPTYEVLARALEGESRVVVAKINMVKNEVPDLWLQQQQHHQRVDEAALEFPLLLWFPASDKLQPCDSNNSNSYINNTNSDVGVKSDQQCQDGKGKGGGGIGEDQKWSLPSNSIPIPRSYWTAGTELHTLSAFILREFSFDKSTYRGASVDQLGMLMETEEDLRDTYREKHRRYQCNIGRPMYSTDAFQGVSLTIAGWDLSVPLKVDLDYWFGEIVFDGKRWHIFVAGACAVAVVVHYLYLLLLPAFSSNRSNGC